MYKTKEYRLSNNWRIGFIFDAFNGNVWRVFKPEITFINTEFKTLILELSLLNLNLSMELYETDYADDINEID